MFDKVCKDYRGAYFGEMEVLCFSFAMVASNHLEPLRFIVCWVVDSLLGNIIGPPTFMQFAHGVN